MQRIIPGTQNHVDIAGHSRSGKACSFAAYLLLLVFTGTFLTPLLSADAVQAGLAICCKRTGKHFCAGPRGLNLTDPFPEKPRLSERCPFQFTHAVTGVVTSVGMIVTPTGHRQSIKIPSTLAYRYPLPFMTAKRADLKRGPPGLIC
jgi:hypothetical protein